MCVTVSFAQKKKDRSVTYAITAPQMGQSKWTEVRQVDLKTGEVLKTSYLATDKPTVLNARTGKEITIKDPQPMVVKGRAVYQQTDGNVVVYITEKEAAGTPVEAPKNVKVIRIMKQNGNSPFATNSAACAYDKKNQRLYYTPMGINQLRYIDLKGDKPVVYYFEDEAFGVVKGSYDHANQVTRMVIANNKGYALTNNGKHLIQFSTGKDPKITDLGELINDGSNGNNNVLGGQSHGGDMVADDKGNLYLITAYRAVYRINIKSRIATYLGHIQGLPKNFTTNGAAVESGTKIVVTSSTSTSGYYIFDLNDLKATKYSEAEKVFNASDFANASLVKASKVKDEVVPEEEKEIVEQPIVKLTEDQIVPPVENVVVPSLKVFPNPVTGSTVNVTFASHEPGRYRLNILDMNGKLYQSQLVTINAKSQQVEVALSQMARGSYLVQVTGENGKLVSSEKLLVQ